MAKKYDAYDAEIKINGKVVAGKTGLSLKESFATIDVTDNTSGNATENMATRYSWTADSTAWVVDDADEETYANYTALQDAFLDKKEIEVDFYHPRLESVNRVGRAIITEFATDFAQDNAISVNISLVGNGKLKRKDGRQNFGYAVVTQERYGDEFVSLTVENLSAEYEVWVSGQEAPIVKITPGEKDHIEVRTNTAIKVELRNMEYDAYGDYTKFVNISGLSGGMAGMMMKAPANEAPKTLVGGSAAPVTETVAEPVTPTDTLEPTEAPEDHQTESELTENEKI